jgi:hypothetical protein
MKSINNMEIVDMIFALIMVKKSNLANLAR